MHNWRTLRMSQNLNDCHKNLNENLTRTLFHSVRSVANYFFLFNLSFSPNVWHIALEIHKSVLNES